MNTKTIAILTATFSILLPATAQEQPAAPPPDNNPAGGWRRAAGNADAVDPGHQYRDEKGEPIRASRSDAPVPAQLVLPAGTWIKARVDQPLSSDRSAAGENFTATLSQPVVVDGFVAARRGQTIEGRVTEAIKAGRAKGTSRLGLELTHMSLVDGRQMPVRTQLMEYSGGTSKGRDAGGVGAATGAGAAIGAAAGGGVGAAIGAGAGAMASAIGILTTRGRATEIYPEMEITFRTTEPITISTERAAAAFVPVQQGDFEPRLQQRRPAVIQQNPGYFAGGGYGYWGGGYGGFWGPSWYSPFYGPSLFYGGPRFNRGGFGGGGFRGGRRR